MFNLPLYCKVEKGIIKSLDQVFNEIGIDGKVLFLTDEVLFQIYGELIKKQIITCAKEMDIQIINTNSIREALRITELIINDDIKYVIGFGGGKVLDVCKYSTHMSKTKFISIPAAISNDGVSSPISVLKQEDGITKSLGSTIPYAIIVDIDVIKKSPINLIKAGIGDTLSNYTALHDWRIAHNKNKEPVNDFAYLMSSIAFQTLINNKLTIYDDDFIEALVQSLIISGVAMEIAGTSRPCSGSEHLFSHAVDYYVGNKNLHGLQVALGSIVMAKLQQIEYGHLLEYLKRHEISVNPRALNISKESFILCMKNAHKMRNNRYTILNEVKLDEIQLSALYNDILREVN